MVFGKLIIIFSFGFCCASETAEPNTSHEAHRAGIITETKRFFDHLGSSSFGFSDHELTFDTTIPEEKSKKRDLIGRQVQAGRFRQAENFCAAFSAYGSIFYETSWQSCLVEMINIAKDIDLINQAQDLYVLSGLMLMQADKPSAPKASLNNLFREFPDFREKLPAFYEILAEHQEYQESKDRIKNAFGTSHEKKYERRYFSFLEEYKMFWGAYVLEFFKDHPYVFRKASLLFPELKIYIYLNGLLIMDSKVDIDLNDNPIVSTKQRNEAAAFCLRSAKEYEQALMMIGAMILDKSTDFDQDGTAITCDVQRNEAAAACFRALQNTPQANFLLAQMIRLKKTSLGKNAKKINERNRYKISAELFRKSEDTRAKVYIAELIYSGLLREDENGFAYTRLSAAALFRAAYRDSGMDEAILFLGLMLFREETDRDENDEIVVPENMQATIQRMVAGLDSGPANALLAVVYLKYGDEITETEKKLKSLEQYELAMEKGYFDILPQYQALKEELEALTASVSPLPEAEAPEDSGEDSDDEGEIFKQEEDEKREVWKRRVAAKREAKKAAWQLKKQDNAQKLDIDLMKTIAESWSKKAVKGRSEIEWFWGEKINQFLNAIKTGDTRLGVPEILTFGKYADFEPRFESRRISKKHRLVYRMNENAGKSCIEVLECGGHYDD